MNKLLLFAALCLGSCVEADIFDIPVNELSGQFDYKSTSDYYDDQGDYYETNQNLGVIALSISSEKIAVTPSLSWEYQLDITDIETHTLSDGQVVYSFRINSQSSYVNNDKYIVEGTGTQSLNDGSTLIGTYDGLYFEDENIYFEMESYNTLSFEKVITEVSGSLSNDQ